MKFNRKQVALSCLLCLIPLFAGLLLWNRLPDIIPTHFNFKGEADSFMKKPMAVLTLPLFLVAVNLLAIFVTEHDPKNSGQSKKLYNLMLWIVPAVGVFGAAAMYSRALGMDSNINLMATSLLGLVFAVIGNYMPKTRPSYTIGIKLPWTLADDEVWTRTHRLAGWLWMGCGLLIMIMGFIPGVPLWTIFVLFLAMVLVPSVYSFLLYKKLHP
jgi:uncharacterized membrane protein